MLFAGCSTALGADSAQVPQQQFLEPVDRMPGDASQHVSEPDMRIDPVLLHGLDQSRHGCSALDATAGACKQPGFAT